MRKNDLLPVSIDGVTSLGSGIARVKDTEHPDGLVTFVPLTAPGDEISCRILKVEKRYAFGKMEELLTPSPARTDNVGCDAFGKCGGCAWRHVQYREELKYKEQHVFDCLTRIGGANPEFLPICGCEQPDGYRNKAQYPIAPDKEGKPVLGYYATHSHRVIAADTCALEPPVFTEIKRAVLSWMAENAVPAYNEETKTGLVRHLYIRTAEKTGETMVCLVATSGKIPAASALIASLREVEGVCSILVNVNKKETNVILGDREFTLWGRDYITDILCGVKVRLSARSFYQVNRCQAERLYTIAADFADLKGEETLLDLYCGAGTIGLSMADRVKDLIGVEIVPEAVEDAKRNAAENGVKNARFLCADAAKAAKMLAKEGVRPDVVVLDPPRKGCDESLIQTVVEMNPDRVVYVSCDPATLARDVKCFALSGYTCQKAQAVDMFPRTAHVECVVLLSRA